MCGYQHPRMSAYPTPPRTALIRSVIMESRTRNAFANVCKDAAILHTFCVPDINSIYKWVYIFQSVTLPVVLLMKLIARYFLFAHTMQEEV